MYNKNHMDVIKFYTYDGTTYEAHIRYKKIRSFTMRLKAEENVIRVSVPRYAKASAVDEFIVSALPKILKRVSRKKSAYQNGTLYLFGKPEPVGELTEEEIQARYKEVGLPYLMERVAYYSSLMGISESYRLRMRVMKRTFGSNSRKTKTLTFQTRLVSFAPEIIDSVVVHELAHCFHFDHSPKFYAVVYRYCPDYPKLRRKLIHDEFAG